MARIGVMMMGTTGKPTATVIDLPKVKRTSRHAEGKWGKDVWALGFTSIPGILLHGQQRLGLACTHMCVLLQLADFWWDAERKPFPSKAELSTRLGLSPRQVQRIVADLEKGGYVKRIERRAPRRGKITNEYDLSGLVRALAKIAPDFEKARQEAKIRRQELATPLRRRVATPF